MTFNPGSEGSNSGLFTPSKRALAGRAGRNNGDAASPARLKMADRREKADDDAMSSSLMVAESDEAEDRGEVVEGVAGANAWAEIPMRATGNNFSNTMVLDSR
mmetsp:Transcript_37337/g.78757  ORF Transcript_37337/g.78757 Transcript_37337/m.78757 type:complete len:103 (+) Transcript_37337:699-1007(+)